MAMMSETPVFGYGSNGIEQLRIRCRSPYLESHKAYIKDYVRCFSGRAPSRQNGAVASIAFMEGGLVYGSVVFLNEAQLQLLDGFEGVHSATPASLNGAYRRVQVPVLVSSSSGDFVQKQCMTYIRNKTAWITGGGANFNGKPSPQYLTRVKHHVEEHWGQEGNVVTITVRRADNLEVVEEWSGNHIESLQAPVDGNFGETTVKSLQQFLLEQEQLRAQGKEGAHLDSLQRPIDGHPGAATFRSLQEFLLDVERGRVKVTRV